jgi:gliding motility-associated-like protein
VSGLLPGELATLTVVALSSIACGNSLPSTVADCAADFDDCSNGATFTEPCDDNNSNTINDSVTRLLRDSSVCEPCRGAPCDFAISLDFDLTIGIGDSIQLNLVSNAGIDSITWGNTPGLSCLDCEEPIAKPTETTTYFVTAFDENGCASGTNITIIVNQERNIYVPNVFSPNGDGINDYFEIQGGPDVRLIRGFNVYDRWGAMAFNAVDYPVNSPEGRWQGDHRGQPVEAGVYIYVAVVEFTDGHIEKISGEVLVMK